MLVLKREKGESIVIDDTIKIVILESSDTSVKIGIDAPMSIEVHREEIYDLIQKENKEASSQNKNIEHLKKILKKD